MKLGYLKKRSLFSLFLMILFISTSGCQRPPIQNLPKLILEIPIALFRDTERWNEFLSRATQLELMLWGREGEVWRGVYPMADWSHIQIPPKIFSLNSKEFYRFEVKIWDRKKDGEPRDIPALTGFSETQSDNWDDEIKRISVKLSLSVSLTEYEKD